MPALKYRSVLAAAIAGLWIVSAAALAPPAISTTGEAALRVFLRQTVTSNAVPAVAVVVVNRDQQIFIDATGKRDVANNAPLTADAIFAIASMTKPITSLAVMMLYEEGKIRFDDPVTKYLPEYEGVRVLVLFNDADASFRARPPARPITIRHLLTHTSGIGYSFADARLARIDDGKKTQVEIPLLQDPGDRFTYGPNTAVLGSIVEKVSGQPLDVFLKTRIFDPVGMKDTFYLVPPDKHDRVVTLHVRRGTGLAELPIPAMVQSPVRGDGGLYSTAGDYGRLMQVFLNGGRTGGTPLVKDATIKLMTTNQIGRVFVLQQPSANLALAKPFPFGGGKDKFGFGFQIEASPAQPGLRSVGSYSWGGINNTHFWIDPHKQIAVAVLMQVRPYYDDAAISVLRGVERLEYQNIR